MKVTSSKEESMLASYSISKIKRIKSLLLSKKGMNPQAEKDQSNLAELISKESTFLFFSTDYDLTQPLQRNFARHSGFSNLIPEGTFTLPFDFSIFLNAKTLCIVPVSILCSTFCHSIG